MTRVTTALRRLQRQARSFGNTYWLEKPNSNWISAQILIRAPASCAWLPNVRTISSKSDGGRRQPTRDYDFVDRLRVQARGGQGGNGSVSLWRSSAKGKFTPADGGNGGNGGDVVLRATVNAKSLAHLSRSLNGARGGAGGPQKRHGAVGKTVLVDVPLGTVVYDTTPADDRMSLAASARDLGRRSSSAANAAAAVRLAEAQPSWQPPQPRQSWHAEQSYHARTGDYEDRRPTASDGLSFASPDLSLSPWSVVDSGNGNLGSDSLDSGARNDAASNGSGAVDGDSDRGGSGSNLQPVEHADDVDGLSFASPDLSFSSWSVVTDNSSAATEDSDSSTHDPWDAHDDSGGLATAGSIMFDSPDLSFSPWGVATPLIASQRSVQPGSDQEASRSTSNNSTHSDEDTRRSNTSDDGTHDSGACFPAAVAGRAGSGSKGRHSSLTEAVAGSSKQEAPQQVGTQGSRAQLDSLPVSADLVEEGQQVVVARGGKGGRGNATYRTRPNTPASKRHGSGEAGETARLVLEMKLLADVGLVGFPNAGKSTLLRGVSRAHPAVASYPFTTLRPQLGTVQFSDGASLTVADIPGLIEGAHANRGLGHAFLRHIQRTRALVFVVDLGGFSFRDAPPMSPARQLALLRQELRQYDPSLLAIPAVVAANKTDTLLPAAVDAELDRIRSETDLLVLPVSGKMQQGLSAICNSLLSMVGSNS